MTNEFASADNPAAIDALKGRLPFFVRTQDLDGLWSAYKAARAGLWPRLSPAEIDSLDAGFQAAALEISGLTSPAELLDQLRLIDSLQPEPAPDLLQPGTGLFRPGLPVATDIPAAVAVVPAPEAVSPPPAAPTPETPARPGNVSRPRPPETPVAAAKGPPAGLIFGGVGVAAILLGILTAYLIAGGGDDGEPAAAVAPTAPAAQATAASAASPAATATSRSVLVPTGDADGTFEHVITSVTGTCPATAGGPIVPGTTLPGTGRWGIGAPDANGQAAIRTMDGLAGSLNTSDLTFAVTTPDGARSGSGTFNRDGASFTGRSTLKPTPACTLEMNSSARFAAPLFSFSSSTQAAAPTPAPAAPTQAPAATQAPAPTQPPAPPIDIPARIKELVEGEYSEAIRNANGAYMVAHLDASAISFYGQQACNDFFSRLAADPSFQVRVTSIRGPEPWTWQIYGDTVGTIQDSYTVEAMLTQVGQTRAVTAHFAWNAATQQLRVFSPCKSPPG